MLTLKTFSKLILTQLFLLACLNTYAQEKTNSESQKCDIILLKSGEEIEAKITEIALEEIKYKKCNYQDGPSIVLSKKEIFKIKYKNGESEVMTSFSEKPKEQTTTDLPRKRRILAFGPDFAADGDYTYLGGEASIEWMNRKNKVGFRITSIFLFREGNFHSTNSVFLAKFYLNQGKVRFFLGPGIFSGINYLDDDYYDEDGNSSYIGIAGTIGLSIDPNENMNITIHSNDGYVFDSFGDSYPVVLGGLSIGFRF